MSLCLPKGFKRPLVTAPKRLQRMLLRLQRYSLKFTYVRGSEMYIADTLSRAHIPGNPSVHAVTFAEIYMTEGLSVSARRLQELRYASVSDCVLQKNIQGILGGWPSQKSDTDLDVRAYYNVHHELTVQNGLVFKDNIIVVPTSVRKYIIATVHRSHHGIQGCIRRAKCWSRTIGLSYRVRSSERSRSYGTSSMSRAAHDTNRATDKLNGTLEP